MLGKVLEYAALKNYGLIEIRQNTIIGIAL